MSKVTIMQAHGRRSGVFSFDGTITATTEKAIKVEANGVSVWYPKAAVKQINASLIEIATWFRYNNKATLMALASDSLFVDGETLKKTPLKAETLPKVEARPTTAEEVEQRIREMFAKLRQE